MSASDLDKRKRELLLHTVCWDSGTILENSYLVDAGLEPKMFYFKISTLYVLPNRLEANVTGSMNKVAEVQTGNIAFHICEIFPFILLTTEKNWFLILQFTSGCLKYQVPIKWFILVLARQEN